MIRCVIFDLDGTITEPFFDFDAIRAEIGLPPDGKAILEEMETMTPEQRRRANAILKRHEDLAAEKSVLNPGARETLDRLRRGGVRIGILTRNKRSNAEAVAAKHGLQFDAVVDREDGPVKPDPFGVLHLCERFSAQPQETLVVGDFLFDLLSGRSAGAKAVLLKNHPKADQFARHADFAIERLDEVLDIIENINNETRLDGDES